jgi:glycine/D-amino acid oxidase-like deaminating enzyme
MNDVVVVGGGINGQAAAAALAARGARVVLVDKEPRPGAEASGRAQGSLRLQGRAAAELPLASEAIELWKRIPGDADIELAFNGNIYLCDDPAELPLLEALVRTAHAAGLTAVAQLSHRDQRRTRHRGGASRDARRPA